VNKNPCLAAALEELAKAGVHHPEIANGGKHLQVRWLTPRGERRMFTVPVSPSDWRSAENTRHDIRRMLRSDGMLGGCEPRPTPVRQLSRLELLEKRVAELERRLEINSADGEV
jgi:hypothetical protein